MTNPHHCVYVVELDPAVRQKRRLQRLNPDADPEMPCVYVGMTGLTPEERFENHKSGNRASLVVRDHGIRLLPELSEGLSNLTYELAVRAEEDLAASGQPRATFMSPLPICGPSTEWLAGVRDGWLRHTALCLETISSALIPFEAPDLSPASSPTGD